MSALQHPRAGERWQHVKRGTFYDVIGLGTLQCADNAALDDAEVVIYRGDDGKLWARGVIEFLDGRFIRADETVRATPHQQGAGNGGEA